MELYQKQLLAKDYHNERGYFTDSIIQLITAGDMCDGKLRHKCFKLALNIYNIYTSSYRNMLCNYYFIAPDILPNLSLFSS